MRVPFNDANVRGSQKWIQKAVNDHAAKLNHAIRESLDFDNSKKIFWLSPLRKDDYAEWAKFGIRVEGCINGGKGIPRDWRA